MVAGGGIAGLAAALRLAEAGVAVTLVETRRKLGGRATSFDDVRTGETLDNCQHVAMRCCVNYLDLCARLGVEDLISWSSRITWIEKGGRTSVLKPGLLPAPAHFTGAFLRAKFLTASEKAAVGAAMAALLRTRRDDWRGETFASWLERRDQPRGAIEKFWRPVIVSACNLDPERVAADCAIHVFQEGFLSRREASMIGVPDAPLVRLYDAAAPAIEAAGGEIRFGAAAERIEPRAVTLAGGERLEADAVICALPFERAVKAVAPETQAADPRFAGLSSIEHSPILGVHLTFDQPVLKAPHAVLVGCATQWLFRKDDAGVRIHAVISAADEWLGISEDAIGQRVLEDVRAWIPSSRNANLVTVRAVKEKRATFAATPRGQAARPATTGPSGLILAGDYVRTGWPATMEGATRSGYLAAAAALGRDESWALAPSLRPSPAVRAARLGLPSLV